MSIDRKRLLQTLGLKNKLDPKYHGYFYDVACYDFEGKGVGTFQIKVLSKEEARILKPKSRSRFLHRIMIVCPKCFKLIGFGRIFQHAKRNDHQ